ncbi:hypothetical protein K435DRAFT_797244 [Dendrothele bispora CBS 962.96]|uniref:Uncharacterized protein n=1 Tax=Dendrothele bispora (strain CBS 962.96) TaxID=1314807 RepID=A0A4S8M3K3_DENBC|nr:hypothetical protein K435DRAFT_797244 [Dendrothele bispora CBS 962.96]
MQMTMGLTTYGDHCESSQATSTGPSRSKDKGKAVDRDEPMGKLPKAKGKTQEKEKDKGKGKENPKERGKRKGKGKSDKDGENEEEEEEEEDIEDPDDPAYEPNAEKYSKKPGPIPNECLSSLNKLAFDFSTEVYKLARQYGKSPDEMYEAAGLNKFKTHRSESTWNCFQVYMCVEKGWKRNPGETQAQFTGRLVQAYEAKLKSKLGNNWTRVDLRREAMYKYVRWYQQARWDQMDEDVRKQGVTLRRLNKAVKEVQKLGRALYEADDVVLIAEIHDINNSNRSKYTGYSPEYELMMKTQQSVLSKHLKYHTAQLVVARSYLDGGNNKLEDPDITEIKTLYESNPNDLDTLRKVATFCFNLDIKLATKGHLKKMYWTNFGQVAYDNHLQVVCWPLRLPAIGPKRKGLIYATKGIPNRVLRKMVPSRVAYYKALGKKKEIRTEEEEALVQEGFVGPRVISWNPEEFRDVSDVGLVIDEDDDVVLSVRDVAEKNVETDTSDGERQEDAMSVAATSRSKVASRSFSSASKTASSPEVDDGVDERRKDIGNESVDETGGNIDNEEALWDDSSHDTDDDIPKPPPKRQSHAQALEETSSDDSSDEDLPKLPPRARGERRSDSDSATGSARPIRNTQQLRERSDKPQESQRHLASSSQHNPPPTSTARTPLPNTKTTKQDSTRASTVVVNFVNKHGSQQHSKTTASTSGSKRRVEEVGAEDSRPNKRTKVSLPSAQRRDPLPSSPPSSPSKSHSRLQKKRINRK